MNNIDEDAIKQKKEQAEAGPQGAPFGQKPSGKGVFTVKGPGGETAKVSSARN